jgi:FkbH-like protein
MTQVMSELSLYWLTPREGISDEIRAARDDTDDHSALKSFINLANSQLTFVKTQSLDVAFSRRFPGVPTQGLRRPPERLAILGSSTTSHLLPGIRMGALRRCFWAEIYESGYGQYTQEILDHTSRLQHFRPTAVLLSLDARHLLAEHARMHSRSDARYAVEAITGSLCKVWQKCRDTFSCRVIQQTALPIFEPSFGHNERRFPGSTSGLIDQINNRLRDLTEHEEVDLLAIDTLVRRYGLSEVYDPSYWHRAKQEIRPAFGHIYGEHVARILSAQMGLSSKCLVLDLDNTLWGGEIGDAGVDGIILGQGDPLGEAFLAFQSYILELTRRGVVVAVCSKNEEAAARLPFNSHPEMLLKENHIARFTANWQDKATNLRRIAESLNVGLSALVFVDDNPVERALVRRELPEVAVPELPDDPALFARCLADAGYFESVQFTAEDAERNENYVASARRNSMAESATDLPGFLKSLEMRLQWKAFNKAGLARVTQLVNKSNQFNLTTQRYNAAQLAEFMTDRRYLTLQMRLTDKFGDNGMIAVVIGRIDDHNPASLNIDTWLMSCRVLGRQVEEATLNVLVGCARRLGVRFLIGEFIPTTKNALVRDHYPRLGFSPEASEASGRSRWILDINQFELLNTQITITESDND